MTYAEAVLSPEKSWKEVRNEFINLPSHLYKFQSFYDENGENPYWKDNMNGAFHMSLGKDFSDQNDCKPYIYKDEIIPELRSVIKNLELPKKYIDCLDDVSFGLDDDTFADDIKDTQNNFQSKIRIGCFSKTYKNPKMWNVYSDSGKGYCIEYDSTLNPLFFNRTFPVIYSNKIFDFTSGYVIYAIDQYINKVEDPLIENIKSQLDNYVKKLTDVPILFKNKKHYEFEKEFRMFLEPEEQTDWLDDKYNLDLSKATYAVYLGTEFDKNDNADKIREEVLRIAKMQGLSVYQMEQDDNNNFKMTIIYNNNIPRIDKC